MSDLLLYYGTKMQRGSMPLFAKNPQTTLVVICSFLLGPQGNKEDLKISTRYVYPPPTLHSTSLLQLDDFVDYPTTSVNLPSSRCRRLDDYRSPLLSLLFRFQFNLYISKYLLFSSKFISAIPFTRFVAPT